MIIRVTSLDGTSFAINNVKKLEETGLGKVTATQYGQPIGKEYGNVASVLCIPTSV